MLWRLALPIPSVGSMSPQNLPQARSNTFPDQFGRPSADRFREPGVAKLLAGSVHRLGDAIGVEAQRVNSDTRAV
jgi:hypothetical protein